jgi:hypothetical protein
MDGAQPRLHSWMPTSQTTAVFCAAFCVVDDLQEIIELAMAGGAASAGIKPPVRTGSSKSAAAGKAGASAASSRPAVWRDWVEESFDSSALVLAGGVLAACVGSLLVLSGAAWARSRSS